VEGAFDRAALGRATRASALQTAMLLGPVVAVAFATAPFVLRVFGGEYEESGSLVLRLLVAAVIPNAVLQFVVAIARVTRHTTLILATQALLAGLAVGLADLLLPRHGITGAAIAWLVAQCAVAAIGVLWLLRSMRASVPQPLGGAAGQGVAR
jgi:O-antigen/teichoic acid export membrane protein